MGPRATSPPSILIVDDEKRLAEVLAVGLEVRGFRAAFVDSVADALAYLESHPVSLVITDLRMPKQGGRELLAQLHRPGQACPSSS
ncbi:MAG: Fis-type precursor [Rubritepida sp.]|nr:Fis-type precursor [Rubritepida sp.]